METDTDEKGSVSSVPTERFPERVREPEEFSEFRNDTVTDVPYSRYAFRTAAAHSAAAGTQSVQQVHSEYPNVS